MNATSMHVSDITIEQEEAARADIYGLLAMLFFSPPQAPLLNAIAESGPQGGGLLGDAWVNLAEVSSDMSEAQIQDEYHQLFIGVSKPDVMLYGSYYLSGFLMEKPLAELRADLTKLGLSRPEGVTETEDHIASLFEVMRILILAPVGEDSLIPQKHFHSVHIRPWVELLCDAIESHPASSFYRSVSNLTREFMAIENQAFEMN